MDANSVGSGSGSDASTGVSLLPSNYQEYYAGDTAGEPQVAHVMDVFKTAGRNEGIAPKNNRKLNAEILSSRDTMAHGYVTMSKNDDRILVLHRITYHSSRMGMPPKAWENQMYAVAGDVMGDQMPQTLVWPMRILEPLNVDVKVLKLAQQITTLMGTEATTLPPIDEDEIEEYYDTIKTRHGMYVPRKYLPMLLEERLTPKEALCKLVIESTSQGDNDSLKPLIDWFRVAVTRSEDLVTSPSSVARTSPPEVALMEPQLLQEQLKVTKTDLPAWNNTGRTTGTGRQEADDTVEKLVDILHKRGPSGISLPVPAKKDQKPSDHWQGTINLLLRIVQVGSEADLPDVWSAWARANKKEHWNVLQEKLQETSVLLGYPQPVATGELTQMLINLQFVSPDKDDLESGLLQPFMISYHGQKTLAQLQRMQNMYDMIQQGAQPNLSDLFTLKEASKISVPVNESQCLRTLKSFAVLLATLLGTTSAIYKVFK